MMPPLQEWPLCSVFVFDDPKLLREVFDANQASSVVGAIRSAVKAASDSDLDPSFRHSWFGDPALLCGLLPSFSPLHN